MSKMVLALMTSGRVGAAVWSTLVGHVGAKAAAPSSDRATVVAWSLGVVHFYGR